MYIHITHSRSRREESESAHVRHAEHTMCARPGGASWKQLVTSSRNEAREEENTSIGHEHLGGG
jgi:hypothetical protein